MKIALLKVKAGYLIQVVRFMYILKKSCSIAKEEEIVNMVDDSTCEVIGTRTVKVTERDMMVHALEAVRYVPEAHYNLISIRVLDEERCQIQVQQDVVTVSQRDRVILKGEKCGWLYKLKEET